MMGKFVTADGIELRVIKAVRKNGQNMLECRPTAAEAVKVLSAMPTIKGRSKQAFNKVYFVRADRAQPITDPVRLAALEKEEDAQRIKATKKQHMAIYASYMQQKWKEIQGMRPTPWKRPTTTSRKDEEE